MTRLASAAPTRFQITQNSDINVTPFVDVMLVLLIIFMVAIPLATSTINLDLPVTQASATPVEPVYVSLQRGGGLFIGDRATTLGTLPADLARTIGGSNPTGQRIYVRADRAVPYGQFMQVVDTLREGGFQKVGLISEKL
ncbi:MAG: biopolymer transporter ExbD [Phenylobacterium sp.]